MPPSSSAMKTYNMYYTTSRLNVKLYLGPSSGPCVYYGESTVLTNKPMIQLRSGDSKSAPAVAYAKIQYLSRHVLLASGDYQEEMRRNKNRMARGDYEFGMPDAQGRRRTYSWKVENHYAKTIYRCVDEDGQVVANMLSGGMSNWKKGGEIEVTEGLEKRLEEVLIVSALGIWAAEAGWSVFKGYGGDKDKSQ